MFIGHYIGIGSYSPLEALPATVQSAEAYQTTEAWPQFLGLTFDNPVDITVDGWTVASSGAAVTVTGVWWSGTTNPVLILSRDILPSETLTVSYDATTGTSESTSGVALEDITDLAVTNSVTTLLREDFLGTSVDAAKGTITNPDVAAFSVTQRDKLIFRRETDAGVGTLTNFWESAINTYTRAVIAATIRMEKGFTASQHFLRLHVDSNNYISIQGSATVGTIRVIVQKSGSTVEYDVAASGISSNQRVKMVYLANNEIKFYYWHTDNEEWTQIGVTQTLDMAWATAKVLLGATSSASDVATDRLSYSNLRVTDSDYTTQFPETVPVHPYASTVLDYTLNTFSEFKPLDPSGGNSGVISPFDGYFYFGAMTVGGAPLNRSHYVIKYDLATNTIVDRIHIAKDASITSAFDTHAKPTIQVDADGHIYSAVEKGADSTTWSNGHNTDILIYKTVAPGDLSTMALWKTLAGKYSYPKYWIDGTNHYMLARGLRGAVQDLGKTTVEKSTDSGANWTEILVINIPTGTPVRRIYSRAIHSDDGVMYLAWNLRNDSTGSYEACGVIKSTDGVTWSNFQGTFSKDVVATSPLTESDLVDNCQIWNTATPEDESITFEGGYVKAGVIKALIGRITLTGVVLEGNGEGEYTELRLFTYNSGWTYSDVSSIIPASFTHYWAYERILQYIPSASGDFIYVIDKTSQTHTKFIEYNITAGTNRIIWQGSGNYHYGANAYNTEVQKAFVLFHTLGDYNNTSNWSYLRVINITS